MTSLRRPLLLAALSASALALAADGPDAVAPTSGDPPTAGSAPAGGLEAALAPLTEDRLFKTATVGLHVVNVRTGAEAFDRNADLAMLPASTMKILTSAAALHTLGPAYRFTTDVYVDKDLKLDAEGVLKGHLYVQGHGDPTLEYEDLWRIVYDLKMEGIVRIDGNVVYDESFLDTNYLLPGWDKEEDLEVGPAYFPPLGALSLNYNTVAFWVGPGQQVGGPARVALDTPASAYVEVDNQVVTVSENGRRRIDIEREIVPPVRKRDPEKLKFTLTGSVPSLAETEKYYRTVLDPTASFMASFQDLLALHGIEVTGKHVRGVAPADGDLFLEHRSASLSSLLMEMNKSSNNLIAEQVLRTLGAEVHGLPGTTAKGLQVVRDYVASLGVDANEMVLVNGSGLTRGTRVRPSHVNAVLLDMARDTRVGWEFVASLSISGRDGTLWRRLAEDPGRLRGKTGTIDGVHCLAGYVEAGDGERYAFTFFVNDLKGDSSQAKRLHDRFARTLFAVGVPETLPDVVEGDRKVAEE